jgi:hypothetical protein
VGEPNDFEAIDMDIGFDGTMVDGRGARKRLIGSDGSLNTSGSGSHDIPPRDGRVAE